MGVRLAWLLASMFMSHIGGPLEARRGAHVAPASASRGVGSNAGQQKPTPFCPSGNGLFVLYYGSDEADWKRIWRLQPQPNFVIVGEGLHDNSKPPEVFHQTDSTHGRVRVLAYVNMIDDKTQLRRNGKDVDADTRSAIDSGYDGIFFDNTKAGDYDWNSARALTVKKYLNEPEVVRRLVIMNPGVSRMDGSIFDYADIVSVENQFDKQPMACKGACSSKPNPNDLLSIPKWRWLAVQGHPADKAPNDAGGAYARLKKFSGKGGFWYYSSPRKSCAKDDKDCATHITLPDWLEAFAQKVQGGGAVVCQ